MVACAERPHGSFHSLALQHRPCGRLQTGRDRHLRREHRTRPRSRAGVGRGRGPGSALEEGRLQLLPPDGEWLQREQGAVDHPLLGQRALRREGRVAGVAEAPGRAIEILAEVLATQNAHQLGQQVADRRLRGHLHVEPPVRTLDCDQDRVHADLELLFHCAVTSQRTGQLRAHWEQRRNRTKLTSLST